MILDILSYFDALLTTIERTDSIMETNTQCVKISVLANVKNF
jgi:hypothetical protein